jgi:hypothetical protein
LPTQFAPGLPATPAHFAFRLHLIVKEPLDDQQLMIAACCFSAKDNFSESTSYLLSCCIDRTPRGPAFTIHSYEFLHAAIMTAKKYSEHRW